MALYEGGKGRALDQFIDVIGKDKPTRRPMHATGREARLGGGVSLGSSEGQRPILSEIAHIGLGAEDGVDHAARVKKGINSLPPCGKEVVLAQVSEDSRNAAWSLDSEESNTSLEEADYDPYWREESIAFAGGVAVLRGESLIVDDQIRMQDFFDYTTTRQDQG